MINWLQGQAAGIGGGLVLLGVMWYAKKRLPNLMSKWLTDKIDKALDAGDDIDDELVLQICYWAERKMERAFPNGKAGELKYKMVADKLIALMPLSVRPFISGKNQKISEVIEANVERLKADLAKRNAK